MSARSVVSRAIVPIALLASLVACRGSNATSPVSPSLAPLSSSTPSGATIVGQVTGASLPAGAMVSAEGTAVSAPVDSSNRFQLAGVPAGDVTLRFTGSGLNAAAQLRNIADHQQLVITVSINGSVAAILEVQRDGSDSSSEAEGKVSGASGSCPSLRFSIGTRQVTTTGQTAFVKGSCADVKDGAVVEVHGSRQADNSIAAQSVEIEDRSSDDDSQDDSDDDDSDDPDEIRGVVTSVDAGARTFQVGSRTVAVTAQTVIRAGSSAAQFAAIKTGITVEVEGKLNGSGVLVATEVEIEDEDDDDGAQGSAEIKGTIAAVGAACPNASFTVSGTTVTASSATVFLRGACADIKVGAKVEAKGKRQTNASIAASTIEFER